METIKELAHGLDQLITEKWDEYVKLSDEFNSFSDKHITSEDREYISKIFYRMQDLFNDLSYGFNVIIYRHNHAVNACNSWDLFIETLKKAGAIEQNAE